MRKSFGFTVFVLAMVMAFTGSAFAQTTVSITDNTSDFENDPGWFFNRDATNDTDYKFTNQKSSIGNGSLYAGPISATAAHKFIAEHFMVMPVAEVDSISFDFMISGSGTAASYQQYYMNVYANFEVSDDLKYYDCRYDVIASVGSTTSFKTVTFDPTQSYPVATRGGATPSPAACPAIPANMGPGATIRAYSITMGDTGTSDIGLAGYFDNVVLKRTSGTTIYNFEMSSRECKNGGWANKTGSDGNPYENQGRCVADTEQRRNN